MMSIGFSLCSLGFHLVSTYFEMILKRLHFVPSVGFQLIKIFLQLILISNLFFTCSITFNLSGARLGSTDLQLTSRTNPREISQAYHGNPIGIPQKPDRKITETTWTSHTNHKDILE